MESPPLDHEWGGLASSTRTPQAPRPRPRTTTSSSTPPKAGPLPIATADGIGSSAGVAVGEPPSNLTIGVETSPPFTDQSTGRTMTVSRIGIVTLPPNPANSMPRNIGVMALSYDDSGVIEHLSAPSANFGV